MTDTRSDASRLGELFRTRLNIEVPGPDTDLIATGLLDSLALVDLLLLLETDFGVQVAVPDLELDDFRTLERISRLISDHRSSAPTPLR